jgi:hypothetical protein
MEESLDNEGYSNNDQRVNEMFENGYFIERDKLETDEDQDDKDDRQYLFGVSIPEEPEYGDELDTLDGDDLERELANAFGTQTDPSKEMYGEWEVKEGSFIQEDSIKIVYRVESENWSTPESYDSNTEFVKDTIINSDLERVELTELTEKEDEVLMTLEYVGEEDEEFLYDSAKRTLNALESQNRLSG